MAYQLEPLTEADVVLIGRWRLTCREGLRTPFMLTDAQQRRFFADVICNRTADSRYWAIRDADGTLRAMCGLTGIQPENGLAEIALITDPEQTGKGIGRESVRLVLEEVVPT